MMDPTSRGDMEAFLMRRWYEANRETWWQRHSPFGAGPDRIGGHADEFILAMLGECGRIARMTDEQISKECA